MTSILAPQAASADGSGFSFGGEIAAELFGFTECVGERVSAYQCEQNPRHRIEGAGPVLSASYVRVKELGSRGWALRWGPEVTGAFIGDAETNATSLGAMMKIGFQLNKVYAEFGGGFSVQTLSAPGVEGVGGNQFLHLGAGIEISERWTLIGRADAHATMHNSMIAIMAGGGLSYRL